MINQAKVLGVMDDFIKDCDDIPFRYRDAEFNIVGSYVTPNYGYSITVFRNRMIVNSVPYKYDHKIFLADIDAIKYRVDKDEAILTVRYTDYIENDFKFKRRNIDDYYNDECQIILNDD